jgi:hypothetical protein
MRSIFIALALLLTLTVHGHGEYFNTPEFWQKLKLEKNSAIPPPHPDTAIIVVSNRATQNEKLRFMSEVRDGMLVRYFYVYAQNQVWHVLPVANLESAIQHMPEKNRNWVVYTEGMGKIFTTDLYRAMILAGQYKVNVILMDYPSITTTKSKLGNYYFALENARKAYEDFVPVFAKIKQLRAERKMGSGKLSLFFHSMGNNVVTETVKSGELKKLNDLVWVDNLILNAPCVNQTGHVELVNKISFAKHIYIHYNPEDKVLKGAHFLSGHRQLGEKVDEPIVKKARYINFNILTGEGHSNFLSLIGRDPATQSAIRHYNTLLQGDTVNLNDFDKYKPTAYKNIGWDILP